MGPARTRSRGLRTGIAASAAALALSGCAAFVAGDPGDADVDRSGQAEASASVSAAPEAPDEESYVVFLRTQDPPVPEFEALSDAQLRTLGREICALAEAGSSPDDILRAWLDTGAAPTDEAIVALFIAADYTYCPGGIALEDWYSSPLWRERTFVAFVRDGAGDFSMTDEAAALEAAAAICELVELGWDEARLVAQLHADRPIGMVPDREGALAFIAASQWALCPEAVE